MALNGRKIKLLRVEKGWSQTDLAREAGLSQPFVSHLERNAAAPSMPTIEKLAKVLDVDPGELFLGGGR